MSLIFDSHAHYNDRAFDEDRKQILEGLKDRGVGTVVDVADSLRSLPEVLQLAHAYDFIYASAGIHPSETGELTESNFTEVEESAKDPKTVAIGEIGLDYHYDDDVPRPVQKKWFARQIALAKELRLPVIIHSRDAAADTLDLMKAENAREAGGVIHCFSYEKEMARVYLDMGFYLGIGGVLTFKNARKLKEVVDYMPADRILLETDCPYLAPEPNRGRRNDSSQIIYVARVIAGMKNIPVQEVIDITDRNARTMYQL